MGGGEPSSIVPIEDAGQQARVLGALPSLTIDGLRVELRLNPRPQLVIDDGFMLAWVDQSLVPSPPDIGRIMQDGVEMPDAKGQPSGRGLGSASVFP